MGRRTKAQIEKDKLSESTRKQFTDWLYQQYDISFLPKYFFINLDKVYKGTYKNLTKPVPVEDLFDMWKRKMPYLIEIHDKNKRHGKNMDGINRISYDLAILLAKYDSYLKWKEQMQLAEIANAQLDFNIDYDYKLYKNNNTTENADKIDINGVLDEI